MKCLGCEGEYEDGDMHRLADGHLCDVCYDTLKSSLRPDEDKNQRKERGHE